MCHRNEYTLRCGHTITSKILHCSAASLNPATNRWRKCSRKTGRVGLLSDKLCGDESCVLSAYDGRWICCNCRYGYEPNEINRISICVKGGCSHEIRAGCLPRTEDNIRSMYAEDRNENSEEVEVSRTWTRNLGQGNLGKAATCFLDEKGGTRGT